MGSALTLVDLVARLRSPDGCPWDRGLTWESLRASLLDEAYEAHEAIGRADDRAARDELGDLLFVIALIARIAEERGAFTLADAERAVVDKLVRRHPHVFGDASPSGLKGWEAIKAAERAARGDADRSALAGVPVALPALLRAQALGRKAAGVGFDWPDPSGPRAKLDEEIRELDEAAARAQGSSDTSANDAVVEELGDVLFSVVNLARHLGVSAESALEAANRKFEQRFRALEADLLAEGSDPRTMDAVALESRWQALKRRVEPA